ncbi:MAG: 4Fe-4S binding protein [Clostridiales bacterium]|nr:4Fe-4S binding protein [Clostridiales bacterium]
MIKKLITKRKIIQFIIAFFIYEITIIYGFNFFYFLAIAIVLGSIMGKTFCRWMCPIGFVMEAITTIRGKDQKLGMYNYHKLGCPIAWIQGYLNKTSLLKIKRDPEKCVNCGLCDKTCYITALNKEFSLIKQLKKDPALSYRCSKCLDCIAVCPTDSLSLTFEK